MTVLVIELNSFHLELLPMYQPLLPHLCGPGIRIRYLVLPALLDRARAIVGDSAEKANPRWLRYPLPSKTLRARYYRRRIQRLVDRLQPAAVVFNTIDPVTYFSVFRCVRHPVKIGIVHNPRREGIDYSPRRSGELIFCLHDYNYHLLREDTSVDGYLSPFFRYREVDSARRPDGRLEIAVQGVISFNRRDYPFLVALCERLAQRAPREEFVFNILGDVRLRDGPRLVRMVQERGLADRFRFHPGLSDRQFFDELSGADFIMPLLNAQRDSYAGAAKVTAAYGHSGAYGIPMILHRDTAELWDITDEACLRFDRRADLVDRLAGGVSDRAAMAVRYREVIAQKVEQNKAFLQMLAREHPTLHRGHRG